MPVSGKSGWRGAVRASALILAVGGLAIWALGAWPGESLGFPPERRRDFEERRPNEYLIIPAVASLPGIGVFVGVISSFSNIEDSGIDAGATVAESVDNTEISVRAVALREVPLYVPGLKLEYQYGRIKLGNFQTYLPGRDSPNFTIPVTAEFDVHVLRPSLRLFERRFNLVYTLVYLEGYNFDEGGNEYPYAQHSASAQLVFDFTDDVVDPRTGVRLGYGRSLDAPSSSIFGQDKNPGGALGSDGRVTSEMFQLTLYGEIGENLVLAWDNQYFQAHGLEDSGEVVSGGSLPLRGYPAGRWQDRYGVFTGLELRLNQPMFTELDFMLIRGILEAWQYAVFYEVGQVSPQEGSPLYTEMHHSYGAGVRALFDSIVLRLDIANSDEGVQTHLTIGQPF